MTTKYLPCHGNCPSMHAPSGSMPLACLRALSSGRYHCNESSSNTSRPLTFAAGTMVTKLVSVCAPNISLAFFFLLLDLSLFEYRHIRCGLMLTGPSSCSISPESNGLPSSMISSVSKMAASDARISARFISSSDGSVLSSSTRPETDASSNVSPAIDGDPSSSCEETTDPTVTNASASTLDAAVTIRTISFPTPDMTWNASAMLLEPSVPTTADISSGSNAPSDRRRRVSRN
mmetsp:Transcript_6921/g.17079  ORF Transcript_6921/g.17079 Transcript_6921/m.17079 type:complete len:233 (+) Transcript_6921:443-1141(+)